jgi:hypothetical protein
MGRCNLRPVRHHNRRGILEGTQPTATHSHQRSLIFAADALVAVHLAFVAFLLGGGFLAWQWSVAAPLHIVALVVSAAIYLGGLDCPLTNAEKFLRTRAGEVPYPDGFIAHYLVRPVYATGMTPALGLGLVVLVVGATLVAYGRHFV